MPQFTFNSIDEVKEFVKSLKGTRGGKGGDDEAPATAPAPVMPPQPAVGFGGTSAAFAPAPPATPFAPAGYPAPTGPAAEVMAIVQRITAKLDAGLASGQSQDQALGWFRGQCGPEAAAATMDQIKGHFLPRMTMPALENIAKLMGV